MRIPLDYYSILSVPVNATLEQLEQAYQDRLQQQPRREYSKQAISARQELIEHSYQVLSDIEQRAAYDAQFLVNMQPVAISDESEDGEPGSGTVIENSPPAAVPSSTIEIRESQVVGALSILHELGEYELVLKIGIDFYNSKEFARNSPDELSIDTTKEDIILSLTLAYLELGREQWNRQEYENAAVSGQMGVDLLKQENLFPKIQKELESDLYKLRPYRVLKLISQNPAGSEQRAKGFELLRSMLIQRQEIENRPDRSGLNFDQFLCFIQQLRTYLTSAEQQQLFDDESLKDSAIANYLAVYALLGRGFSLKQPELVLRARRKLDALNELRDVSWEQAVTALLLGHTELAISKLKSSPDPTKLEQVEQHSASSIDLLPGLCFYGEKWLQEDVVAQYSDLTATDLTLKEYFGDRQVQSYLEQLAVPAAANAKVKTSRLQESIPQKQPTEAAVTGIKSVWRNLLSFQRSTVTKRSHPAKIFTGTKTASGTATIKRDYPQATDKGSKSSPRPTVSPTHRTSKNGSTAKSLSLPLESKRAVPASVMQKAKGRAKKRVSRPKKLDKATLLKGWLFILGLAIATGAIGFTTIKLFLSPNVRTADNAQLAVALNRPAVKLPPKKIVAATEPTFAELSQQTIQTWLDSKSAAFGKEHQIERLNNILTEPLLSTWRDRARAYKQGNLYREYEHDVTMRSATVDPNDQNKATIEAEVKEIAKHYQSGKLDDSQSYNDNLLVRYEIIRQKNKWLIKDAQVLKSL